VVAIERPRGIPRETARRADVRLGREDRKPYAPSPWGFLRRAVPPESVTRDDVFVDLGCGMGRVLLEAAELYPFGRVVGVELVPRFAESAEELLRRNAGRLRAGAWEVVNADAAGYEVPDDVTVAYLYDPFAGTLFESVLARLAESVERRPRRLRIVYLTPAERDRLGLVPGLAVTRVGKTGLLTAGARHDYLVAELRGAP
jgi:SAM-dependent methyltransferase